MVCALLKARTSRATRAGDDVTGGDMGVAKRWVFPIIRIVLVAVIAIALAKLAFFPDRPLEEADPAVPTGSIVEPVVPVALGTVTNDVVLDATVSADPAVPVKNTADGTVNKVLVEVGASVAEGDTVFDVKVEIVRDPARSIDAEGNPLPPIYRYQAVTAPISGTLSSLDVIPGQAVAIGQVSGQVAPPSFSISGTLQPAQQYRLLNQPTEASVAITGGPAPFTCTGLRITTPLAGASSSPDVAADPGEASGGAAGGGGAGTTVSCAVPADVTVFPGLAAEMTIAGGRAENVLVVPTTAVRGVAQTGTVWIASDDGSTEERAVTLGITDGQQVEITAGLTEGEMVREFAPGAAADGMDGCSTMPDGSTVCESVS